MLGIEEKSETCLALIYTWNGLSLGFEDQILFFIFQIIVKREPSPILKENRPQFLRRLV